jgi:hypothetical protein
MGMFYVNFVIKKRFQSYICWIHLDQGRDQEGIYVKLAMNLWFHKRRIM